jgi:hypothetical protein
VSQSIPALEVNGGYGQTERQDAWWLEGALTIGTLALFTVYALWAASQGNHFEWGPYLSPFYSPNFKAWFPALAALPFSPAFLILWAPLGFRGTCYFYRRAYHRSAFGTPPACSVSKPKIIKNYTGESKFPFVLNNLHRFFFYIAALLTVFHWTHVVAAFNFNGHFGIGTGSLVLLLDAILLTCYTFSCHSWRHLLAGKLDCFSCGNFTKTRYNAWVKTTGLNNYHMQFAWSSLITVGFADLYIRLVSMGIWTDYRIL